MNSAVRATANFLAQAVRSGADLISGFG